MGETDRWAFIAYLGHGNDPIRAYQGDYIAREESREISEQRIVTWDSDEVVDDG